MSSLGMMFPGPQKVLSVLFKVSVRAEVSDVSLNSGSRVKERTDDAAETHSQSKRAAKMKSHFSNSVHVPAQKHEFVLGLQEVLHHAAHKSLLLGQTDNLSREDAHCIAL